MKTIGLLLFFAGLCAGVYGYFRADRIRNATVDEWKRVPTSVRYERARYGTEATPAVDDDKARYDDGMREASTTFWNGIFIGGGAVVIGLVLLVIEKIAAAARRRAVERERWGG